MSCRKHGRHTSQRSICSFPLNECGSCRPDVFRMTGIWNSTSALYTDHLLWFGLPRDADKAQHCLRTCFCDREGYFWPHRFFVRRLVHAHLLLAPRYIDRHHRKCNAANMGFSSCYSWSELCWLVSTFSCSTLLL